MIVAGFARVSGPRDGRFELYTHCSRGPVSRGNDAEVGTRGCLFFSQLCRYVASVDMKGPVTLSLGIFSGSSFDFAPYSGYRQYGAPLLSASRYGRWSMPSSQ